MPCVPIFRKNCQLWLFRPKFADKWILGSEFEKSKSGFGICTYKIPCINFQLKRTTLTFLAQVCPKRKFGYEIQKTNVGIRISMLEIPYVPIFKQNRHLWLFGPKFAQEWILGSQFQKSKSGFGISILRCCAYQFSEKLWIFGPKFAQKWILGSQFQKSKSGFRINTSNIYHMCQFSVKMDNF